MALGHGIGSELGLPNTHHANAGFQHGLSLSGRASGGQLGSPR